MKVITVEISYLVKVITVESRITIACVWFL